jgi:hypothetical protein
MLWLAAPASTGCSMARWHDVTLLERRRIVAGTGQAR